MSANSEFPMKVFYDGSCYVCSSEMYVYMGKDHGGRLEFVDISDPDFNPAAYGISMADFMYQMHAIDRTGRVFRGVEAFRAIWHAFPNSSWYRFLGGLVTVPGVNIVAGAAYRAFAGARKYLPKKSGAVCKTGKHFNDSDVLGRRLK